MQKESLRFEIAYYSGTGSTALAANCLHRTLLQKGCSGSMRFISQEATSLGPHDTLFLLFPIHSFNAPEPVYQWIESIDAVDKTPAVVLAISGGGEIPPNTAGSLSSIKRLEARGYVVTYDAMIMMPNNFWFKTDDLLAIKMIEVLPKKIERIVDEVLSGVVLRPKRPLFDRAASRLGEAEKPLAGPFGKAIQVLETCTGCGICSNSCPAKNIILQDGRPVFEDRCHLCLGCIYRCPNKSLAAGKWKFVIIKEGYDLKRLEERVPLDEPVDIARLAKGYLWSGARKYLLE